MDPIYKSVKGENFAIQKNGIRIFDFIAMKKEDEWITFSRKTKKFYSLESIPKAKLIAGGFKLTPLQAIKFFKKGILNSNHLEKSQEYERMIIISNVNISGNMVDFLIQDSE